MKCLLRPQFVVGILVLVCSFASIGAVGLHDSSASGGSPTASTVPISPTAGDSPGRTPTPPPAKPTTSFTPVYDERLWGDQLCDGVVSPRDALVPLTWVALGPFHALQGLPGCPGAMHGVGIRTFPGDTRWGDVDCDGAVAEADAIAILRWSAEPHDAQTARCPAIGQQVGVVIVGK